MRNCHSEMPLFYPLLCQSAMFHFCLFSMACFTEWEAVWNKEKAEGCECMTIQSDSLVKTGKDKSEELEEILTRPPITSDRLWRELTGANIMVHHCVFL